MDKIKHPSGNTPTSLGLETSLIVFKNSTRFEDDATTKVLITLTDGKYVFDRIFSTHKTILTLIREYHYMRILVF